MPPSPAFARSRSPARCATRGPSRDRRAWRGRDLGAGVRTRDPSPRGAGGGGMNGRTMDLRPTATRDRVRVSRERDWITRMTVVASVLVSIAWLGGSWRLSRPARSRRRDRASGERRPDRTSARGGAGRGRADGPRSRHGDEPRFPSRPGVGTRSSASFHPRPSSASSSTPVPSSRSPPGSDGTRRTSRDG